MDVNETIRQARGAAYWGRYQWLQELWRMGERLTLERWGRAGEPGMEEERAMRQLGQGVEALLEGFDGYEVRVMDDVVELTPVEREILVWLARGYDVEGIAEKTLYSASWIYQRLRVIKEKLAARTDVGAVIEGLRMGVIGFPSREEMKISDE